MGRGQLLHGRELLRADALRNGGVRYVCTLRAAGEQAGLSVLAEAGMEQEAFGETGQPRGAAATDAVHHRARAAHDAAAEVPQLQHLWYVLGQVVD